MTEDLKASEGLLELMRDLWVEWPREEFPERLNTTGYFGSTEPKQDLS